MPNDKNVVQIDEFYFNFDTMEYFRRGEVLNLSRTEQKLLKVLVSNKGRTLTRNQLMDKLWTEEAADIEENALSVTVKRLRDKLEDTPSKPRYIKTVYGIGYVWEL